MMSEARQRGFELKFVTAQELNAAMREELQRWGKTAA